LLLWAFSSLYSAYLGASQRGEIGYDYANVMQGTQHWVDTGQLYWARQLEGPYDNSGLVMLYPPIALYLFVPFLVIPSALWWGIPLGILLWHLIRSRPGWWSWPILAACAGTIPASSVIVYGNTDMWTAAVVALACRWPGLGAALAFKPTLLPLGILWLRRRAFWAGVVVVLLLCLPLGGLWIDWFRAVRNFPVNPLYSWPVIFIVAIPLVAWFARTPTDRQAASPER
jgi:hypothetical protein